MNETVTSYYDWHVYVIVSWYICVIKANDSFVLQHNNFILNVSLLHCTFYHSTTAPIKLANRSKGFNVSQRLNHYCQIIVPIFSTNLGCKSESLLWNSHEDVMRTNRIPKTPDPRPSFFSFGLFPQFHQFIQLPLIHRFSILCTATIKESTFLYWRIVWMWVSPFWFVVILIRLIKSGTPCYTCKNNS